MLVRCVQFAFSCTVHVSACQSYCKTVDCSVVWYLRHDTETLLVVMPSMQTHSAVLIRASSLDCREKHGLA
jgi:hypothetical protein